MRTTGSGRHTRRLRPSAVLAILFVTGLTVWQAAPADAVLWDGEDGLRRLHRQAVIEPWADTPPGTFATKQQLLDNAAFFAQYGFDDHFMQLCREEVITVRDYADRKWAYRLYAGGPIAWIRLGDEFNLDVQLHVFIYKNQFINRVCGNFTDPGGEPFNLPPTAVAKPQTVEQQTRAGSAVALDASGSSDPDGDALVFSWFEGNEPICPPTSNAHASALLQLGRHTVRLKVDDGRGHTAEANAVLTVVDTTPPRLTVPGDITVEQATRAGTVVNFGATADDICDANPKIISTPSSGTVFPLGDTTVTFTATDASGNTSGPGKFTVHVVDTTPPVLTVPEDITVEQATSNGTEVNFEVTASDVCDANPQVTVMPPTGTEFPLGDTVVTCTATDASGNACEPRTFKVHVIDTTPPTVNLSVGKTLLWPVNHKLEDVGLSLSYADICDAAPDVQVSVTQDEPLEDQTGDGHFAADAKLTRNADGSFRLQLRSSRKGDADGRVYLIIATVTDASGNTTVRGATVVVPKSQSIADKRDVAAQAATALANGTPLQYNSLEGPEIGPKQ